MNAGGFGYTPYYAQFQPFAPSSLPPQNHDQTTGRYDLRPGHEHAMPPNVPPASQIPSNGYPNGHPNMMLEQVIPQPSSNQQPFVNWYPNSQTTSNFAALGITHLSSPQPRDEKVQPSAESGGIPDPTPEYLARAAYPPLLLPHPRKILVVIDLNGTLLFRPHRKNPTKFVERPYARTFLSYCIDTFTVVIWSSAKLDNVTRMCDQLLTKEERAKVVAVWGRDKFGLSSRDYKLRVQCYKRLSTLWNAPEIARSHPDAASGGKWSQADTVLVDDSFEKAKSEPYNLISIPEFEGNATEPNYVLPQVHNYLNECSQQADVSTYMRATPFKINANFKL